MGLFKCAHQVSNPTSIKIWPSDCLGEFGLYEGATISINGTCDKCKCVVDFKEIIINRYLYLAIKQLDAKRGEK